MIVLVVEPSHFLGALYAAALHREGHDVRVVHDAQAAVYETDKKQPDVIILELQLSGHSGVEFLYELRSYPEWQHIPVVCQSFVPKRVMDFPRQLGVRAHLYKPRTSLAQLARTINEVVAKDA